MSKPISISFGKSKASLPVKNQTGLISRNGDPLIGRSSRLGLRHDSDDDDDAAPAHELVTGFAIDGAILSHPAQEKEVIVIKNAGNGDWRRRGRGTNLLPSEVQAQREAIANGVAVTFERDEVSKASGLQFAKPATSNEPTPNVKGIDSIAKPAEANESNIAPTDDEVALKALLSDDARGPKSNAVILQSSNTLLTSVNETDDFRADVASRPDSCTLDEYAEMPVEEFGMAMLRGMGQKRKANGEIVDYGGSKANGSGPKLREPRQGYLGIGAKAAPGAEVELGAWGKAAMRKNKNGEGLYTPVMLRDKRTGEILSEEELGRRKKEAEEKNRDGGGEDWRDRRDRNLERDGRKKEEQKYLTNGKEHYREHSNGGSRDSSTSKHKDRDGYDSSRSKRDRSRSRERDRRRKEDSDADERYRERRRDKYRDDDRSDDRNDSRSSHKSGQRDREGHRERHDDRRQRSRH